MPYYLGIDTSNYTTSAAVFDSSTGCVVHKKKLLPVAEGALGLKQSDAVFAHVKQLPQILEELFFAVPQAQNQLAAVGVSVRPRNAQDSYMPCFLTGRLAADAISAARPGARRENMESYIKRLETLEALCNGFEGVESSYAVQAGREVRILVQPDKVGDDQVILLARQVAKKIEDELDYPGQIKVSVIRESRATEYAK